VRRDVERHGLDRGEPATLLTIRSARRIGVLVRRRSAVSGRLRSLLSPLARCQSCASSPDLRREFQSPSPLGYQPLRAEHMVITSRNREDPELPWVSLK